MPTYNFTDSHVKEFYHAYFYILFSLGSGLVLPSVQTYVLINLIIINLAFTLHSLFSIELFFNLIVLFLYLPDDKILFLYTLYLTSCRSLNKNLFQISASFSSLTMLWI